MEQLRSSSNETSANGPLDELLVNRSTASLPLLDVPLTRTLQRPRSMRESFPAETTNSSSCVVAPPAEWASTAQRLMELARGPLPSPSWWTNAPVFHGGVETRTDPSSNCMGEWNGPRADESASFVFQLGLAGWGDCYLGNDETHRATPGKAFFALRPSQERCSLPAESPGWTFAWISVQHSYLASRVAKQVDATGPVIDLRPDDPLVASALRLVRGALRKDFRDRFEAEIALFEFVVAFERWAQRGCEPVSEGQRLMDEVRAFILARLPKAVGVRSIAGEFGMSRSHFSHFFREQTGLTPAHFATEVRIQKAASMLVETRSPLKTIADSCGFANANHLCKVFRRLRHISPSSFRQGCR